MLEFVGSIIVAVIAAIPPTAAVVIKAKDHDAQIGELSDETLKHQTRSEIMQLITDDRLAVMGGGMPTNYKDILSLHDEYDAHHWNSYEHRKVEEYIEWYKTLSTKK